MIVMFTSTRSLGSCSNTDQCTWVNTTPEIAPSPCLLVKFKEDLEYLQRPHLSYLMLVSTRAINIQHDEYQGTSLLSISATSGHTSAYSITITYDIRETI